MKQKSACNKWLCLDSQFESDLLNPNLATSPWSGHRQFAFDLMVFMQPQVVVELGTHYGCSFFAFLQAAKDFDLDVSIYAIDSWVGDEHAGFYGDDVFDLVKTIVFQHFKSQNAVMLRKRFDEALSDIQDGCINLLHIDGLHTYDAVKHDFETWLPKLAKDGVVLFHDIAPDTGYGSAKYWSEIKHKFPHYEFLHHSWGLGVLFPKGDLWHHEINNGNHSGWLNIYRYQAESKLLKKQLLSAEAMIDDRDKAIQSQTTMIDDRDKTIQSQTTMIDDRDKTIQSQAALIDDHRTHCEFLIQCMAYLDRQSLAAHLDSKKISERLQSLEASIIPQSTHPFSDIAFSLYQFIERLFTRACKEGVRDLYFLSREGWDLKELFEIFQNKNNISVPIRTHYLEASRRSSFLPSLGPLADETFEVLFRQYRAMSLESFLNSLGLEVHSAIICEGLGVDEAGYRQRRDDLPKDPIFEKLKGLAVFQQIYESERENRSAALAQYVASFTDGALPEKLTLVDVGWKGSIQDNLYRWLSQQKDEHAQVHGFYIGLNASGAMDERNVKTGLMFEGIHGHSRGYNILNENRSLFEVLLPARHGGPYSYEVDTKEKKPVVLHEPYYEEEMVATEIQPIVVEIFEKFRAIASHQTHSPLPDETLFKLTCKRHFRMVFNPSQAEMDWLSRIHHRENFGVFEESALSPDTNASSLIERLRFTYRLVLRTRPREIGFWPYLSLKRRAFYGVSTAYRVLRKWQERSLKC